MRIEQDGVLAFFAAVGLSALLWMLLGGLLYPRRKRRSESIVLVPAHGSAEELEWEIHLLEQERHEYGSFSDIVIVDCGMDESAYRTAQILCRENYDILCLPQQQIAEYLKEREKGRNEWESGSP